MDKLSRDYGHAKKMMVVAIFLAGANAALDVWQMQVGRFSAYYSIVPFTALFQFGYYYLIIKLFSWFLEKAGKAKG